MSEENWGGKVGEIMGEREKVGYTNTHEKKNHVLKGNKDK